MSEARFAPGDAVLVKDDWPEFRGPAHIRTPHYLRGKPGRIVRVLGEFANPEDLAFARPAPKRVLYHVLFVRPPLWAEGEPADDVLVEVFEHWLEPAPAERKAA
jgi:nitrile hydratase